MSNFDDAGPQHEAQHTTGLEGTIDDGAPAPAAAQPDDLRGIIDEPAWQPPAGQPALNQKRAHAFAHYADGELNEQVPRAAGASLGTSAVEDLRAAVTNYFDNRKAGLGGALITQLESHEKTPGSDFVMNLFIEAAIAALTGGAASAVLESLNIGRKLASIVGVESKSAKKVVREATDESIKDAATTAMTAFMHQHVSSKLDEPAGALAEFSMRQGTALNEAQRVTWTTLVHQYLPALDADPAATVPIIEEAAAEWVAAAGPATAQQLDDGARAWLDYLAQLDAGVYNPDPSGANPAGPMPDETSMSKLVQLSVNGDEQAPARGVLMLRVGMEQPVQIQSAKLDGVSQQVANLYGKRPLGSLSIPILVNAFDSVKLGRNEDGHIWYEYRSNQPYAMAGDADWLRNYGRAASNDNAHPSGNVVADDDEADDGRATEEQVGADQVFRDLDGQTAGSIAADRE